MNGLAKIGPAGGEQKQKASQGLNVTIGIFFDGTMNNKTNVHEREIQSNSYKDTVGWISKKGDDSYENDYSNVARLVNYYANKDTILDKQFSIYIEGIGTKDKERDSSTIGDHSGGAFGAGSAGIRAKVKSGCQQIADKLKKKDLKLVQTLTLDVFGFSRGSAAARNFINEVTRSEKFIYIEDIENFPDTQCYKKSEEGKPGRGFLGYYLKDNKINISSVIIRFVGLFETVSSYSPDTMYDTDFDDDIRELHLDAIRQASKVVHLTAADEHRENFALTNISSTGAAPVNVSVEGDTSTIQTAISTKGIQLSLPGVHSDIGGCYIKSMNEKVYNILDENFEEQQKEKERLIANGWYLEKELFLNSSNNLYGERQVSNQYSFIPLHMMSEFANRFKDNLFDKNTIENIKYKIPEYGGVNNNKPSLLSAIKKRLYHYAFDDNTMPLIFQYYQEIHEKYKNAKTTQERAEYQNKLDEQMDLRNLRHKYLHWNADYEAIGMKPNIENGKRKRIIYDDVKDKKNAHWYNAYNQ